MESVFYISDRIPEPLITLSQATPSSVPGTLKGLQRLKKSISYSLYLRRKNQTQSREEEWDFHFNQKRGYQLKVEEKSLRLVPHL